MYTKPLSPELLKRTRGVYTNVLASANGIAFKIFTINLYFWTNRFWNIFGDGWDEGKSILSLPEFYKLFALVDKLPKTFTPIKCTLNNE